MSKYINDVAYERKYLKSLSLITVVLLSAADKFGSETFILSSKLKIGPSTYSERAILCF